MRDSPLFDVALGIGSEGDIKAFANAYSDEQGRDVDKGFHPLHFGYYPYQVTELIKQWVDSNVKEVLILM